LPLTFSPDSRRIFLLTLASLAVLGVLTVAGVWYYATPSYTRVGYKPTQPIGFSHAIHVTNLGMDCRYCHNHVGQSPHSNVPATQLCMNCHGPKWGNIRATADSLAPLREAFAEDRPVPWIRIHRTPDYVYFNHAVHVGRGVSCVSCHGQVNEMPVVYHAKPLSMSWCLECHRDPQPHLRPADQVTNLEWSAKTDPNFAGAQTHAKFVDHLIKESGIHPPQDCSGCHR